MGNRIRTYKVFLATVMLLFVCSLSNTTDNSVSAFNMEMSLNTKVIISHISHTCSPATVEPHDEKEKKNEPTLALKENKYYSLVKLFGEDAEKSICKATESDKFSSYKGSAKNIIIHKSLQQIGVLLI